MKFISLGLCAFTTVAFGGNHTFETGMFYTKHSEKNYKYEVSGGLVQYKYLQQEGKNLHIEYFKNFSSAELFVGTSWKFSHHFDLSEFILYPVIGHEVIIHKVLRTPDEDFYLTKQWLNSGIGMKSKISSLLTLGVELLYSFHHHHSLSISQGDQFAGFHNPLHDAYQVIVEFEGNYGNHFHYCLNGNVSKDWKNTYLTRGAAASIQWRF